MAGLGLLDVTRLLRHMAETTDLGEAVGANLLNVEVDGGMVLLDLDNGQTIRLDVDVRHRDPHDESWVQNTVMNREDAEAGVQR